MTDYTQYANKCTEQHSLCGVLMQCLSPTTSIIPVSLLRHTSTGSFFSLSQLLLSLTITHYDYHSQSQSYCYSL